MPADLPDAAPLGPQAVDHLFRKPQTAPPVRDVTSQFISGSPGAGPAAAIAAQKAVAGNQGTRKRDSAGEAPIFIVHGSDTTGAQLVARAVERATGRDAIILREQPNGGRTLIEKFEAHAQSASYAIVLLTPDDEGGHNSEVSRRPRARQNVIFEMGYFYGQIGRGQVSVLLDPRVEQPSDMNGIAYISFTPDGQWKRELFQDMHSAGVDIAWHRIP